MAALTVAVSEKRMDLSAFIHDNPDAIVDEWGALARALLPAATTMSDFALRSHGREILIAIVKDMQTSRNEVERSTRSGPVGLAPAASQTVAATRGALRHAAGFDLARVVSEFRAMRASVLALWRRSESTSGKTPAIEDIARFNEAIDQALGESVARHSHDVAASHDVFLAVLAHDLRSPLEAIELTSYVLVMPALSDAARVRAGMRVRRASRMMSRLITDLLEFTRSRLGRGIQIERTPCDLGQVCVEVLHAVKASYPEQEFVQRMSGDLHIRVDRSRLQQVLSNLLNNAIQHGDGRTPVSLSASGAEDAIVLTIANSGNPIRPDALKVIFEPPTQAPTATFDSNGRPKTGLGLGLFIAREIVLGHHGTIDVQSSADAGTTFTIRLPRASSGEVQ